MEDAQQEGPDDDAEIEPRVEAMAKALYASAVDQVRQHVSGLDLQAERISKVLSTARVESDRSAAILIFALAEDLMLDVVKRYCNLKIAGGFEELTGGNGLLASANDRITFLALLNWIPSDTYKDLRLLKSIRNRFAHHSDTEGLSDGKVKSWVAALSVREPSGAWLQEAFQEQDPTYSDREVFLIRAAMIVSKLVDALAIGPQARARRVDPSDVASGDFDSLSENRKENIRVIIRHMLAIRDAAVAAGR